MGALLADQAEMRMSLISRKTIVVVIAGSLVGVAAWAKAAEMKPELAGHWVLNKEKSDAPAKKMMEAMSSNRGAGGGGGFGGGGGGMGGRGGFGGGRGGGGGGRGGSGGGGGRGGGRGGRGDRGKRWEAEHSPGTQAGRFRQPPRPPRRNFMGSELTWTPRGPLVPRRSRER